MHPMTPPIKVVDATQQNKAQYELHTRSIGPVKHKANPNNKIVQLIIKINLRVATKIEK